MENASSLLCLPCRFVSYIAHLLFAYLFVSASIMIVYVPDFDYVTLLWLLCH